MTVGRDAAACLNSPSDDSSATVVASAMATKMPSALRRQAATINGAPTPLPMRLRPCHYSHKRGLTA